MTRTSALGEVSRMAIMASMTWPWVANATSRIGQSPSMIAAPMVSKKEATTGRPPSVCWTLGGP